MSYQNSMYVRFSLIQNTFEHSAVNGIETGSNEIER